MEYDYKYNNKYVISNSIYVVKTIFRYAPVVSGVYTFLALTAAVFTPLSILFLQRLIDSVADFLNKGAVIADAAMWGGFYILALFGTQMFWFFQSKLSRCMNRTLMKTFSPAMLDKFTKVEYKYFEDARFRDIVSRLTSFKQHTIYSLFADLLFSANAVIQLIGILGIFFAASMWIGIGAALIGIPMLILEYRSSNKKQRLLRESTTDQRMGEYLQRLFCDKHSAYEIKIFRAKNHLLDLWQEVMDKIFGRYRKITKTNLKVSGVVSLLKIVYTAFAVITLTLGFVSGKIGLGVLVSVISAIGMLFSELEYLYGSVSRIGVDNFIVNYYREFIEFAEREQKENTGIPQNADIVFDNVTFTYPETEREILHNVSFTIKSCEKTAVVGVNGAGKSTVIKLLCGLYKPDNGHIYIGGRDITSLSQDDIRQAVSVVFQDFVCYQLTLRENIAFGDLSAIDDDARLTEALRLASADEVLAKGLDVNLGQLTEDGIDFSKGQWQRIATARAFLSHADFIILDEPTASLDPIAESHMYEAFIRVLKDHGTIIISHRLASAKMADKIIVIEGGEVVGIGSHTELMKEDGLYAMMFGEQSGWYKNDGEAVTV